jgi:hypothetical protein
MYSLPPTVILRAQKECVVLNPDDVMYEGELMQRLGTPIPDELIEQYARDKVRVYADDAGQWCAEPLR